MTTDIEFIGALVTLLVSSLVVFGVSRHVFTKGQIAEAYKYAVWGVSAAEEMFAEGNGQIKFEYVRDLLLKRFGISEEDARMLVNAAVQGLRNAGVKPLAEKATVTPIRPDAA